MENTGISGKVWLSLGVTFFKVVENTKIIGWLQNEQQKRLGWPPFQYINKKINAPNRVQSEKMYAYHSVQRDTNFFVQNILNANP